MTTMLMMLMMVCASVAPHQPRLDYQMWFAGRGHYSHNHWLLNLVYRLLTQQHQGTRTLRTFVVVS